MEDKISTSTPLKLQDSSAFSSLRRGKSQSRSLSMLSHSSTDGSVPSLGSSRKRHKPQVKGGMKPVSMLPDPTKPSAKSRRSRVFAARDSRKRFSVDVQVVGSSLLVGDLKHSLDGEKICYSEKPEGYNFWVANSPRTAFLLDVREQLAFRNACRNLGIQTQRRSGSPTLGVNKSVVCLEVRGDTVEPALNTELVFFSELFRMDLKPTSLSFEYKQIKSLTRMASTASGCGTNYELQFKDNRMFWLFFDESEDAKFERQMHKYIAADEQPKPRSESRLESSLEIPTDLASHANEDEKQEPAANLLPDLEEDYLSSGSIFQSTPAPKRRNVLLQKQVEPLNPSKFYSSVPSKQLSSISLPSSPLKSVSSQRQLRAKRGRVTETDVDMLGGNEVIDPLEKDIELLKTDGFQNVAYTFWDGKQISVRLEDIGRLNQHVYVNDTIIWFYMKFYMQNLVERDPESAEKILMLDTFFCYLLNSTSVNETPPWVARIPLKQKKIVIMPVHERVHWSLIVFINFDDAIKSMDGDNPVKPTIVSLDSLDKQQQRIRNAVSIIRRVYLAQNMQPLAKRDYNCVMANVPTQKNGSDCGVYLLHYIECIMKDPERFVELYTSEKPEPGDFWEPELVPSKREQLKEHMKLMGVAYPDIQLEEDESDGDFLEILHEETNKKTKEPSMSTRRKARRKRIQEARRENSLVEIDESVEIKSSAPSKEESTQSSQPSEAREDPKSSLAKEDSDEEYDSVFPQIQFEKGITSIGKPAESEPVESEPVESEPVESAPAESAPVESEPVESEPVESEPVEPIEPVEDAVEPIEMEPIEPVEDAVEPIEPEIEPIEPEIEPLEMEPVEPIEPSEPIEPVNPVEIEIEPIDPIESIDADPDNPVEIEIDADSVEIELDREEPKVMESQSNYNSIQIDDQEIIVESPVESHINESKITSDYFAQPRVLPEPLEMAVAPTRTPFSETTPDFEPELHDTENSFDLYMAQASDFSE